MICCCSPPNHRLDSYETLLVSAASLDRTSSLQMLLVFKTVQDQKGKKASVMRLKDFHASTTKQFGTSSKNDVIMVKMFSTKLKAARKHKEFSIFKPKNSLSLLLH